MDEIQLYAGLKLTDEYGFDWRIVSITKINCLLLKMHVTSKHFIYMNSSDIYMKISTGELSISEDQEKVIFDVSKLNEKMREDYVTKKEFLNRISELYGPSFADLTVKRSKPEYLDLLKEYNYSIVLGNRLILRWLQGGCQDGSWMDPRYWHSNSKARTYEKKTGPKTQNDQGIVLTDKVKEHFEYGVDLYKHNKKITKMDAYSNVLYRYYTTMNESGALVLVPVDQRPTYRQFYHYMRKRIDKAQEIKVKTSRDEFYNDHRYLFGFNRESAVKPGYIVEVDALEMDINIVSSFNNQQNISRPIIYMMTDLYSHAIVAFHVGFDNNSMLGLSSLMMNLFDDKTQLLKEHGIKGVDIKYLPSRFIPHEIRCDRGSDFASDQFAEICKNLNIMRTLEHGATGSMKGLIEQSFRQFHQATLPLLEHQGVILKRYDSNHKKEACLTIEQIYTLIVMFIIKHNKRYVPSFELTKEMRKANVDRSPISIWGYGVENAGLQNPITEFNYQSSIYHVLPPGEASLCREGVRFKGLIYRCSPTDKVLLDKIMLSQVNRNQRDKSGKSRNALAIKYDPRSIDEIYYLNNGTLEQLSLDPHKNDELEHITWSEYDDYRKMKAQLDKQGFERNMEDRIACIDIVRNIGASATLPTYANTKQINDFRKLDRDELNYNNRVSKRISKDKEDKLEDTIPIVEPSIKQITTEEKEKVKENQPIKLTMTDDIWECPPELCDF